MEIDSSQSNQQFLVPILGEEAECLIQLNQELSNLGINNTIKLSSIVVIGDQSTGKSSLIERISGVVLPKSAGLCTRCCIGINLSSGRAWKCSVFVEEAFSYNNSARLEVTPARPMGPWEPKSELTTTKIGDTHDKDELVGLIAKAQNLVLNPTRNKNPKLELFSPNKIRLDLAVGTCPNLSFVDMPGTISSLSREQPGYYVDLVSNLAAKAASDENNIVLLTLPANHDVSNSRSYGIIQKQKAQSRVITCHTKVDVAREEELRDLLARHFSAECEEEFEYGTHIVMLRESDGDVAQAEKKFFSQAPWKDLPLAIQKRLGVANLVEKLRSILFKKTEEALPENLEKVRTRIAQVDGRLKAMPPPPDASELPYQLREYMLKLEMNVKQLFAAGQENTVDSARNKLRELMRDFSNRIQSQAPTLLVISDSEKEQFEKAEKLIIKKESGAEQVDVGRNSTNQAAQSSASRNRNNSHRGRRFTLDEIRALNQQYYHSAISGDIEPKALEAMRMQSVGSWDETFQEFMEKVNELVCSEVLECVRNTFEPLEDLPIYEEVQAVTGEYLDGVVAQEQARLQEYCNAEMQNPLSHDDMRLTQAEEKSYAERHARRAESRLKGENAIQKAKASSKKKSKDITADDLGPDLWDVEVRMAAKTNAYYAVASHRFVDSVCVSILARLKPLCGGGDDLVEHIRFKLGLNDIDRNRAEIVTLMTENQERERKRLRLTNELQNLRAGHKYISDVLVKLQQLQISQAPGIYNDLQEYESALYEGGFMAGGGNSTFVSPPKRRVAIDDDDQNQIDSPSKRVRRTRLPSRARSVTIDEMEEDD